MKPGQTKQFEVIPAVDILGGKCVRLTRGNYNEVTVYYDDPFDAVKRWANAGAVRIHIVDLDSARKGMPVDKEIILRILSDAKKLPSPTPKFQVSGGIRDDLTAQTYLDAGADRVIIGSRAIIDPVWIRQLAKSIPGRFAVSLDARGGMAATEGWRKDSGKTVEDLVPVLADLGVPRVIYTDISRDGTLAGADVLGVANIAEISPVPVIASGGVATDEDIQKLRGLFERGVEGCIVGKALYEGKLASIRFIL